MYLLFMSLCIQTSRCTVITFIVAMCLSRCRDCRVYSHVRFYPNYLCLRPGCGWEVVCWTVLCDVVSSLMWVSYLVHGSGAQLGFPVPRHLHLTSRDSSR